MNFPEDLMANIKSALKNIRKNKKRYDINKNNKTKLLSQIKKMKKTLDDGNKKEAKELFSETVSVIDRSVQKRVIPENTASRYKSRLGTRVRALTAKK